MVRQEPGETLERFEQIVLQSSFSIKITFTGLFLSMCYLLVVHTQNFVFYHSSIDYYIILTGLKYITKYYKVTSTLIGHQEQESCDDVSVETLLTSILSLSANMFLKKVTRQCSCVRTAPSGQYYHFRPSSLFLNLFLKLELENIWQQTLNGILEFCNDLSLK